MTVVCTEAKVSGGRFKTEREGDRGREAAKVAITFYSKL